MTGWDGERGEGETEWERSNGWKRRGEGKRGTRDALSQGELLSFFVAALQKDRTKERNAREPGPGPFRGQFENPFRSVRDLFVYARNTRRSPLSSQPIRSRYHFTWPGGGRRRSVVSVTRARIHRGEGKRRRVKFWTRPSSSLVVPLVFLLFGAEHRPRRCPMIYTRPEKDS